MTPSILAWTLEQAWQLTRSQPTGEQYEHCLRTFEHPLILLRLQQPIYYEWDVLGQKFRTFVRCEHFVDLQDYDGFFVDAPYADVFPIPDTQNGS
jgi:hypothetical protein